MIDGKRKLFNFLKWPFSSMRPHFIGISVFVAVAALTQVATYQRYIIFKENEIDAARKEANYIRFRLTTSLSYSLSATKTLAFFIRQFGVPSNFDSLAQDILESNKYIDALELTRKGTITHVYPLKGNEPAIGYDILTDERRNQEAYTAIEKGELYFAGPLDLKQGGKAVVGRLPVYQTDGSFFGFSVVIIKLPTLLRAAGLSSSNPGFEFQLTKVNPSSGQIEMFLPERFNIYDSEVVSIDVPYGGWVVYVKSKKIGGWFYNILPVFLLGIVLSAVAGVFAWYISIQPEKVNRLYLFTSRINHVMVNVKDEQVVYKEICRIAVETGKFKMAWVALIDEKKQQAYPAALAGEENGYLSKVVPIDVRPEATEGPFLKVLRTESFFYCNDISRDPFMKRWTEEALRRGYHSLIILPIKRFGKIVGSFNLYASVPNVFDQSEIQLLLEVTADISFTLENIYNASMLKKASHQVELEKMMSDSIINSLPGIFYMYDDKGKFVRWNKNFEEVSGYSGEEIEKMIPIDFFHADEQELLRERIQSVFETGYSDVTAYFYTKDHRKLPYFFNGRKVTFNGIDYLIGMGIDISKRVEAERGLLETTNEIRRLTEYLENIREEERTHISREIHDVLGQQLTGIKMDSSWIKKRFEGDKEAVERITQMNLLIDDTIKSVRRISSQLRPGILDDLGLIAALEWQASEFEKRTGITTEFYSTHQELDIPGKISTNIFRIFQECLTNIARHSRASRVKTSLDLHDNSLELTIIDNGIGIDMNELVARKSLGIVGMKERARLFNGELTLRNNQPSGTVMHLHVPLHNHS